ncbi:hypothetical protein PtB15_9B528 [Puccinia triticina]|nr:hypothetical protein PtB15_9B528 [Puccinia triticina]
MSRSRPCPPSSAQPASDEHAFPAKPAKRTLAVTSPGWDPVGDDDALYIQSDDTHRRASARAACIDQALLHARKRKRTAAAIDSSQPPSRPSTASQAALYPGGPILGSFSNHHLSSDPPPAEQQELYVSPPRTPPPSAHQLHPSAAKSHAPQAARDSPGQLCNILSPSFLNGSPNSLLRRLNAHKHLIDTEASCLADFPPPGMPDKVFSPSRFLGASAKPLPPVAEPVKRADPSPPSAGPAGSVGLLDAHLNSASSSAPSFIFSPSRAAAAKKAPHRGLPAVPRRPAPAEFPFPGPSKTRRPKKPPPADTDGAPLDLALLEPLSPPAFGASSRTRRPVQPGGATSGGCRTTGTQTMARTIWSRRLEEGAGGMSSSEWAMEQLLGPALGGPSSEPACSEGGMEHDGPGDDRGLSAAVVRGLHAGLGGAREPGRSDALATSSPPVLPPPSDCSEGITPLSADPASDEPDEALRVPPRTSTVGLSLRPVRRDAERAHHATRASLADITPSFNRPSPAQHPTPKPVLAPEIIAALSQAISAGISADEIADVLRALDDPGPAPGPRQHAHPPSPPAIPAPAALHHQQGEQPLGSLDPALAFLTAPDFFQPGLPLDCPLSVQDFERFFGFSPAHILDGAGPPA